MAFVVDSSTTDVRADGEINMTSLIDVMLVLLVIFIITAPLMTHAIRLDLPKVAASGRARHAAIRHLVDRRCGQAVLGRLTGRARCRALPARFRAAAAGGTAGAEAARVARDPLRRDRAGDGRRAGRRVPRGSVS